MEKFEIKFYVMNDHLEEMKEMSLEELEYEYSSIYGQFTFMIGEYAYLVFLKPDEMPQDMMPTERIDSHFYNLIRVIRTLQDSSVAFMNYIENDWTWVKFQRDNEEVTVSELKREHDYLIDGNGFNPERVTESYFENAEIVSEEYLIDYNQFVYEVDAKLIEFIDILERTNTLHLRNKQLKQIIEYYNTIS